MALNIPLSPSLRAVSAAFGLVWSRSAVLPLVATYGAVATLN